MAVLAQEEEEYWEREIARLAEIHLAEAPGAVLIRAGDLICLGRPVARRLLRHGLARVRGDLRGIGFEHVEEILDLAGRRNGSGRIQIPDAEAVRSFEWIRLSRAEEPRSFSVAVPVPGTVAIPGASIRVSLSEWDQEGDGLDWDRAGGPLEVRNWKPGDTYRPLGQTRPEKIKDLFQRHRIPSWERVNWPVLAIGASILWSRQFGPAAEFAATPESRRVLRISLGVTIEVRAFAGPEAR
jgi:tRNA(Ile)-lysidine synthase